MQYIANLNRRGEIRQEGHLVEKFLSQPNTKVILSHKGRFLFDNDSPVNLSPDRVRKQLSDKQSTTYPNGMIYLGEYQEQHFFVYPLVDLIEPLASLELTDLRTASLCSTSFDLECLFYAQGLLNWHHSHSYCAKCGSKTSDSAWGHSRICNNTGCAKEHFPRIEPAVIFSIESQLDGVAKILLARQKQWPEKRYSVLAGFAEHGESLELAVKREAFEEAGVLVDEVKYITSQPWPFPASLMVGFSCKALTSEIQLLDDELEIATWFSAAELEQALLDGSLLMPFSVSISWQIIDRWFSQQTGRSIKDLNLLPLAD
jgi:NAD+ diphosphatase